MKVKMLYLVAALSLVGPPLGSQMQPRLPLSLMQAESLALAHSDALRIQNIRIQSSARRFALGIRDFLPQIELGFTTADTVNTAAQDSSSDQLSVSLREPLYNGGRALARRSLSRLELTLAQHSAAIARADILNDVWDKYHKVLVLQAQRAVKQDALTQSERQLEIARTERGLGMIREIDLLDVEVSVSGQEIDLQATEHDLEAALYALQKSLGLSPDQELALEGRIDSTYEGISIKRSGSSFFSIAQQNNLDLQTARYKVTQMETQLAMTRSRYLPQIDASISFSVSGAGIPLQTPSLMLGVDIAFPQTIVPVKGSVSAGTASPGSTARNTSVTAAPAQSITGILDEIDAELQLEEARAAVNALIRDLTFQIGQSISSYRRHATTVRLERQALALEQKKLRILEQQVASGSATRMDLLKERIQASNQEVKLLADILSLFQDERSLERQIGVEPGELALLAGGNHDGS
ncbi:MAG: TolC family protein [Spirochaetia bacterium]|jgi:outer membrane protein TolC